MISCCICLIITEVCTAQMVDEKTSAVVVTPENTIIIASGSGQMPATNFYNRVEEPQPQTWIPPVPAADDVDWIQLTSGEWLKGELKSLYDNQLEFDSDELDLLKFDWEDVKYVRSPRILGVRLMEAVEKDEMRPIIIEGYIEITEKNLFVIDERTKQTFNRDQIVSIAPGGGERINYWSGKFSVGIDIASGNTDQTDYNGKINLKRSTSATRFNLDYIGSIKKTDGEETFNNHRASSFFDFFLTRNFFLRPIFGNYYRDPVKNIEYQVTVGSAAGYHIINTPKTKFSMGGGPAAEVTQFKSVVAGEKSDEWTPAFMGVAHFETEWTRVTDFDYLFELFILNEKSGAYTHYMAVTLENDITSWLDFDISFIWDHVQDPTPEANGTVPDRNDYHWMFTMGVEF